MDFVIFSGIFQLHAIKRLNYVFGVQEHTIGVACICCHMKLYMNFQNVVVVVVCKGNVIHNSHTGLWAFSFWVPYTKLLRRNCIFVTSKEKVLPNYSISIILSRYRIPITHRLQTISLPSCVNYWRGVWGYYLIKEVLRIPWLQTESTQIEVSKPFDSPLLLK